jgi:hypothetical protein
MTLMILLVAGVPVLIMLWLARMPVAPRRIARFERRHPIVLSAGQRERVVDYLAHTRRWRAFGAAAGYAAGLAGTLSSERLVIPVAATVAGWLAGAVMAEFRYGEPDGGVVPGRLLRVPAVLAAVTAVVTVLMLVLGRSADRPAEVSAWGLGALACAAAILMVNRHIAGRPGPVTEVSAAIASHSAGSIAAVGTALAVACLAGQATVIREGYFDRTGSAVGLVAAVWALGGAAVGWCLAEARSRSLIAVVAGLALFTAGAVGVARWRDHPPYPASVLHATATIRLTDTTRFEEDARVVGASGLNKLVLPESQLFVGRLDYRRPASASNAGYYRVVVIDKRQNRVAPMIYGVDGGEWDGRLSDLARRYPWLSAMATRQTDGGYAHPGLSVSAPADAGPITFVGAFPDAGGLTVGDLMVVLIFHSPDHQTYWAERVS